MSQSYRVKYLNLFLVYNFLTQNYLLKRKAFSKIDLQLKVKHKINLLLFGNQFFPIHPTSSYNSRKCHQFFFLFENDIFTLSPSSSSSNYKIAIVINTTTTMNNQFEALNAPKIDLPFFFLHSYELNTTSLSLSLHIKLKKPKILILHFLWFIESKKLTILGGSLSFEILCSWRSLMCAKEIISQI